LPLPALQPLPQAGLSPHRTYKLRIASPRCV
jgi:hypothetical protein